MPNIQLVPLLPRAAGILKDGSLYQGDYCTNGKWVRFYQGKPRKMGGQRAIKKFQNNTTIPQGCFHFTSIHYDENIIYIAVNKDGIYSNKASVSSPTKFLMQWMPEYPFINTKEQKTKLWQSEIVISKNLNQQRAQLSGAQTYIALFGANTLNNINDIKEGNLYKIPIEQDGIGKIEEVKIAVIDGEDLDIQTIKNFNGGICYVDNLLFIYGTQGTVAWSRREDPFVFIGKSASRKNITSDKVIYAAGVRGGNNPPTVLFWTMGSVVRLSNQSADDREDDVPDFQIDLLTSQSSILSSRSVVEYDGIFFWLGIDRMFLYNGVVREVVNNINFDWFFKTLDPTKRQLVFGVKNSEKGEIWWYFPVLGKPGGCSAALIYNIRENIWYNTDDIYRDCGFFDPNSGKMITYGRKLILEKDEVDDISYIWIHEDGISQISDDGHTITPIPSIYTTPIISLTAFSPFGEGGGQNHDLWIDRIEPDFNLAEGAQMQFKVNARTYGDQDSNPIAEGVIKGKGGKTDVRAQGRNISFTFETTADFTHGHPLIGIKVGDGRG